MKSYKVTVKNKHYFVKAKDSLEAVDKVEELRDDRLSPMTYRKLKEYGYTSGQWKNWTQEQANKVIASRQNKTETKKSTPKEGNAANSKGNSQNSRGKMNLSPENIERLRHYGYTQHKLEKMTPKQVGNVLNKLSTIKDICREEGRTISILNSPNRIDLGNTYKACLAMSRRTPEDKLRELATDNLGVIRECVAENPNIPYDLCEKLLKDKDKDVREKLAKNRNIPIDILVKLYKDKNSEVREVAGYSLRERDYSEWEKQRTNKNQNNHSRKPSGSINNDIENMLNEPFGEEYDGDIDDISDVEEAVKKMYPDHDIAVVGNYGFGEDDEDTYENYQKVAKWCDKNGYDYEFVDANRDVEDYEGSHWDIPAGRALVISKKGEKQGKVRKALGDLLSDA